MPSFWPWLPLLAAAHTYLACRRLLAYLRYYQQEGYEQLRFLRWTNIRSLTDPAFWLSLAAAFLFLWAPTAALVGFVVGAIILGIGQPDPRRSGKVLLKLTWRATRVHSKRTESNVRSTTRASTRWRAKFPAAPSTTATAFRSPPATGTRAETALRRGP